MQVGPHRLRFALVDVGEESLFRQLYEASVQDPLTHLYNRKYLSDRLVAEVSQARRSGAELELPDGRRRRLEAGQRPVRSPRRGPGAVASSRLA